MRELREAILAGGATISGLQGQGGVGKTALALKLAEQVSPMFPDAEIYLNLLGIREKPLAPADAMSHVIRAFHPEAKLPEKEHELAGIYQSVLHGKRALLLMDNAKDAAQVRPLIPPAGCAMVVTSRLRFTLPGLQPKNLDTLPPSDAVKLLLKIAPRIDGEASAIAKLCGYLPQALRLAASAVGSHVDLAPADYAKRLADEKNRLKVLDQGSGQSDESMDASISLSYRLLDAEMQKRWRMLAVFPETFDASAAAAIWQIEEDAVKDTLSHLTQYSMLEWNDKAERYRLHDLMRAFAGAKAAADEQETSARRHGLYYLGVLRAAGDLYLEGGESVMRGLALFDAERGNIEAGQAWAAGHAGSDREAARACSGYPDAGVNCLDLRQHPRELISWMEAALKAAQYLKDRRSESTHLGNLGSAYAALGETRRAIEYHERALAIDREGGDRRSEGQDLGNLANRYFQLGEARRAIEYHEEALAILREIGEKRGEGSTLCNLGIDHASLGETRSAIQYYDQALETLRELGDRRAQGNILNNLGSAYADLGETRRAVGHHEQALLVLREIGDRRGEGNALGNLGIAYRRLGNPRHRIL
jgi:tetratricopeptide (TPR) repeat protein